MRTASRFGFGVSLLALLIGLAPPFAARASAQGASFTITGEAALWQHAGGFIYAIVSAPESRTGPLRMTMDAASVAANKFLVVMTRTEYVSLGRPCPSGSQCFVAELTRDVYVPAGPYSIGLSATDVAGRVTRGALVGELGALLDRENDGLPDPWQGMYRFNEPSGIPAPGGPNDDPDGDGTPNIEEYRQHTNPRGRYQRVFTEASHGDRQGLAVCVRVRELPASDGHSSGGVVRMVAIGDDGRSREQTAMLYRNRLLCPLAEPAQPFVAARVVALVVESSVPFVAERQSFLNAASDRYGDIVNASLGVQAASEHWFFARGGTERGLGLFFLAFNPNREPVEATFHFHGEANQPAATLTRTLPPGVRTTIWVNEDAPNAPRDAATLVVASAPVYVERAWRYQAPGRTAPHDSVSRGASVPSTWWYFSIGDLSAPFDTSYAIFNPSGQAARVEARFLFADRAPETRALDVAAGSRLIVKPRELGIGGASVALVLHAADGVGIVAERTTDGATASSVWRQSALGVTEAGTTWTFADTAQGEPDWVIANPSSTDARVRVTFYTNYSYADDRSEVVTVPAGRVASIVGRSAVGGWVTATSESINGAPAAPIVVERASYVDVDGVRRARQVSIAGNLTQP